MRKASSTLYMTLVTTALWAGFSAALWLWADRGLMLVTACLCSVIWGS